MLVIFVIVILRTINEIHVAQRLYRTQGTLLVYFGGVFNALEVFNLLGIRNTINHTWIQDVTGRRYAIPNYLTSRRINLKFALRF